MNVSDLKALHTLLSVESTGSYAGAARTLGLTRAAVSRTIAEAEARLGVRLCRRTTRQVVLTDAARDLLRRVEQPLDQIRMALESAADSEAQLSGEIRVSVSHAFGRKILLPLLQAFIAAHPHVRLTISLADTLANLVGSPIDIAVRLGPAVDANLIARPLRPIPAMLCAAPRWVEQFGEPRRPADLLEVPCIAFRVPGTARLYKWQIAWPDGEAMSLPNDDAAITVDSIEAVADLVKAGFGAGVLPPYLAEPELSEGRLRVLLRNFPMPAVPLHVLYYHRDLVPPRVKALIDFIVARLG